MILAGAVTGGVGIASDMSLALLRIRLWLALINVWDGERVRYAAGLT
jgi:hypothetical protein